MKKFLVAVVLSSLVVSCSVFRKNKEQVLFYLDGTPSYVSEFKDLFQQNKNTISNSDLDQNLKLMVDYKLKLKQAKLEGLDTLTQIKKELKGYKTDLAAPYLTDDETLQNLLKEAYHRTKWERRASHILISIENNDTVAALNTIEKIKKELKSGADFGDLAVKYSADRSAKTNKGDLGYFSAFKMVYPFEQAAYTTPVGTVSEPVKTQFGYHLVKVVDEKKTAGKVRVAHIMLHDLTSKGKQKIDSIHGLLKNGGSFRLLAKEFSTDGRTKNNGGELRPFGKGDLPKSFENVAFAMKTENELSVPFTTPYGWHIVQFKGKDTIASFETLKKDLKKKILSSDRGSKPKEVAFAKLEAKHTVTFNKQAQEVFKDSKVLKFPSDSLQAVFLTIDQTEYLQEDYLKFIKYKRLKDQLSLVESYKQAKLKDYIIDHLEDENLKFKKTIDTYRKGLMIFELMKSHVWDVPKKEEEKVEAYYNENKSKYNEKGTAFKDVRGYVESDYQNMIEKKWLQELRDNSEIKFKKGAVKKLKKTDK